MLSISALSGDQRKPWRLRNAPWIAIQSGQSGNANGTVVLAISANPAAQRVGQVTLAGQIYTVTQEAQATSPAPPSPPPPSGGGPTSVEVTGAVKTVSGRCPSLAIAIGSRSIVTNADTDFQNLKCTDIKKNVTLRVDGIAQTGTTVLATQVRRP